MVESACGFAWLTLQLILATILTILPPGVLLAQMINSLFGATLRSRNWNTLLLHLLWLGLISLACKLLPKIIFCCPNPPWFQQISTLLATAVFSFFILLAACSFEQHLDVLSNIGTLGGIAGLILTQARAQFASFARDRVNSIHKGQIGMFVLSMCYAHMINWRVFNEFYCVSCNVIPPSLFRTQGCPALVSHCDETFMNGFCCYTCSNGECATSSNTTGYNSTAALHNPHSFARNPHNETWCVTNCVTQTRTSRRQNGNNFIQEHVADYSTALFQYVVTVASVLWILRPWLSAWKTTLLDNFL